MGVFVNKFRYFLLTLTFLCLTSIAANYIIINFTFICMDHDMSETVLSANGTEISRYAYPPKEKSLIIGAVAAGTIIGTFPINWAYIKFGARWPFFIAGVCSVFSTALVPLTAKMGLEFLLFVRFIQGVAYAADFAAIGLFAVRWAPLKQMGLFISALTNFTPVAAVITNPLSGWLCSSSFGWKASFYLHALFGMIVFPIWFMFYHDDPHLHKNVSVKELEKIQRDKTKEHIERDSFVPYWEIIKNKTVLIIWFNAFCEMVAGVMILTYMPLYLNKVLQYDVTTTGILVSITAIANVPMRLFFGFASDKIKFLSERTKMCICNTFAVGIAGIFVAAIGLFDVDQRIFAVLTITLVNISAGFNPGGFYKCATFVARQYAHVVIATIQFMKCIALFVVPAVYAIFVYDEHDRIQWSYVFYVHAVFLLVANFMFYFVATDQPATFTYITRRKNEETVALNIVQ